MINLDYQMQNNILKSPSRLFWSLMPFIFILNVIITFSLFFPNLSQIGMWDESQSINAGQCLVENGSLARYTSYPLTSFLYGLVYLPVKALPLWFVHCCGMGRFLTFILLWTSMSLIAKQWSQFSHPFVTVALLFAFPVFPLIVENTSDALFAAMSAFAFWQMLCFCHHQKIRHVAYASVFMGLAALARNDGLCLAAIFVLLSLWIGKSMPVRRICFTFLAGTMPFLIIVSGYLVLCGLNTGDFRLGTPIRWYSLFECGQGFAYSHLHRSRNAIDEEMPNVRRLFGTPEENRFSVIRAIRRNPEAFLRREVEIIKKLSFHIPEVYGKSMGLLFLLLVFRGLAEIISKKKFLILSLVLLWPAHLLVYFMTGFRPGYLMLPYFVFFAVASAGVTAVFSNLSRPKERWFWMVMLAALMVRAIAIDKPSRFVAAAGFFVGFILINKIMEVMKNGGKEKIIGLLLALSIAMAVQTAYPVARFRTLGIAADERAVIYMENNLEPGQRVATYTPGMAIAAKMTHVPVNLVLRNIIRSDHDLTRWMQSQEVKAIYVNEEMRRCEPALWTRIKGQIGKSLKVGFSDETGQTQVLLAVAGTADL